MRVRRILRSLRRSFGAVARRLIGVVRGPDRCLVRLRSTEDEPILPARLQHYRSELDRARRDLRLRAGTIALDTAETLAARDGASSQGRVDTVDRCEALAWRRDAHPG